MCSIVSYGVNIHSGLGTKKKYQHASMSRCAVYWCNIHHRTSQYINNTQYVFSAASKYSTLNFLYPQKFTHTLTEQTEQKRGMNSALSQKYIWF